MSGAPASAARADPGLELLEGLLRRGLCATVRARGGSMWPWLRDGDVLTLAPFGAVPPAPGEVLAARRGDLLVIHRVLRAGPEGILLRGDALLAPDPIFTRSELLGRVIAARRGRRVWLWSARHLATPLRPATRLLVRIRGWLARSLGGGALPLRPTSDPAYLP